MSMVGEEPKHEQVFSGTEWDAVEWWEEHCRQKGRDSFLTYDDSLRALAAEAERRGMMRAVEIFEEQGFIYGEKYRDAIERAAKGEG